MNDARIVLPSKPYTLVDQSMSAAGIFDALFQAYAPVHPEFNGTDTWAATVGLAAIPADAWPADELSGSADDALRMVSRRLIGQPATAVTDQHQHPVRIGAAHCVEIAADVHYRIKRLASSHDRIKIIGCPDSDSSVLAAISSVPDDAPAAVRAAADASMDTFRVR